MSQRPSASVKRKRATSRASSKDLQLKHIQTRGSKWHKYHEFANAVRGSSQKRRHDNGPNEATRFRDKIVSIRKTTPDQFLEQVAIIRKQHANKAKKSSCRMLQPNCAAGCGQIHPRGTMCASWKRLGFGTHNATTHIAVERWLRGRVALLGPLS